MRGSIDGLAQGIHRVKMLLPEPVDRVQDDVSLDVNDGLGILVTAF